MVLNPFVLTVARAISANVTRLKKKTNCVIILESHVFV